MYQQRYAEVASDSASNARERERDALQIAIAKLALAKAHGPQTPQSFEATAYLRRLWSVFLIDLSHEDNALPEKLRASLISIGMWVRREADMIDAGDSKNFEGLIEINQMIAEGLR